MNEDSITVAAEKAEQLIERAAAKALLLVKEATSTTAESLVSIAKDIEYLKRDVSEIKTKLENNYVSKDEFTPVRNIVYGLVGILGVATVGAILRLIIKV